MAEFTNGPELQIAEISLDLPASATPDFPNGVEDHGDYIYHHWVGDIIKTENYINKNPSERFKILSEHGEMIISFLKRLDKDNDNYININEVIGSEYNSKDNSIKFIKMLFGDLGINKYNSESNFSLDEIEEKINQITTKKAIIKSETKLNCDDLGKECEGAFGL